MHSNTISPTAMRPFTLRRATDGDLDGVLALLAETAGWLNRRGVRQWPADGFPAGRITPLITEGVLYLLEAGDGTGRPPPSPWTPTPIPSSGFRGTTRTRRSTSTSWPWRAVTPAAGWARRCWTGRACGS